MSVSLLLLCLLLTSARRSDRISPVSVLIQGYRAMFVFSVCRLVSRRCHNISTIPSGSDTLQTSRGKTQSFLRVNAGFIKHTPLADGGLHGHVPTRPGCTTPHIRFLFVAPRFWIGLPSNPASRRRPCPSPNLRLREHLVRGLTPR